MFYFIRTVGEKDLGPLGPLEALNKAKLLRDRGVVFFLTNEDNLPLVSSDQIRRSDDQPHL